MSTSAQLDLLRGADFGQLRSVALSVEASLLSESLSDFAKAAWHVLEPSAELKWGWALDAICAHLQAVTEGHITRLLMNVPPGCMKSLLTGVIWPAWEWTRPGMRSFRYLGTSHRQDLAVRDNTKCRRLIQSRWYRERWPDLVLTGDQNAKSKFENTATGFREAMAFTGMTGSRGDRVLVDDPLSVDSANSEADIKAAEITFLEALPTRVNNESSAIVVIMQRLAEGDTSGIILSRKLDYVHLMLPMEFEVKRRCSTSIGFVDPRKKEGELLFPERFPLTQVTELKRTLGSYATAGQLQQSPTPRGGGLFETKYRQMWPAKKPLPDLEFIIQSYDTAFTDKTTNDPTACLVLGVFKHPGRKKKPCVLVLDAWDDHLKYPALRKRVMKDYKERYCRDQFDLNKPGYRVDEVLIEEKGSGISLIQDLQRANVPARSYNPGRADKTARAHAVLPLWEDGCVYFLESLSEPGQVISWARPFDTQLTKFNTASVAHDDYVDALTQALRRLRDAGLLELDSVEEEPEAERPYGATPRNPYD